MAALSCRITALIGRGVLLTGALALASVLGAGCGPVPPDYSDLPQRKLVEVYPQSVRIHVVKKGETLTRLAKVYSVTVAAIVEANPGIHPDRLRVGQKLVLPPGAAR